MSLTPYIVLSAILFTIGSVGVLTRRNAIVVFMCVELMLNACNLCLLYTSPSPRDGLLSRMPSSA